MPPIGWQEMLVLAVVAIVVIGPKDLPKFARMLGQMWNKVRGLAQDFHNAVDDMARQAEIEDLQKQIRDLKNANPIDSVKREFDAAINPMTGERVDLVPDDPVPAGPPAPSDAPAEPLAAAPDAVEEKPPAKKRRPRKSARKPAEARTEAGADAALGQEP